MPVVVAVLALLGGAAPVAGADVVDVILDPVIDSLSSAVAGVGEVGAATTAASAELVAGLDAAVNALAEGWITGGIGQSLDPVINAAWHEVGGPGLLIGNGANGVPDASLAAANGAAGGLLFGDGGNGATDAAGQGGAGGAAGLLGDGGAGGAGASGG
ncbi:PGRS repeat-containing protein, partial [Mycobacterium sp.]|uniref:PGRS repeat-containing protein n=1 Tax=Mycobacterium sp. TaxID=1785 RepID=UPI00345C06D9